MVGGYRGPWSARERVLALGSCVVITICSLVVVAATPASASAAAVVPPGPPLNVTVVATQTQMTISWDPPASDGGAPILQYDAIGDGTDGSGGTAGCGTYGETTCVVGAGGFVLGTTYTFRVIAYNEAGNGPESESAPSAPVTLKPGSSYHPVSPVRILDSRRADNGFAGKVVAPTARSLQVTGRGGPSNVPTSATAVVMNVTVVESSNESFLTVYPTGGATPNASNLNFGASQIIANLVTVKLGVDGKVDIANAVGATHVVADLVGYYDDGTGPGDRYNQFGPRRQWDSRVTGGPVRAGVPRDLQVRGTNDDQVPDTATAVVANITVTGATAAETFVSVYPSGEPAPNVSNLNARRGQAVANLSVVKIGANGSIRFANAVGDIQVIVDVVGWFDPTFGARFHATAPNRILDTRVPHGLAGKQGAGDDEMRWMTVAGSYQTGVPFGATAMVANVTVAEATAESFVAVFAGNATRPQPYSNLNFGINQVVPNHAFVGIAPDRTVMFYNHLGQTHLIADVVGWFAIPYETV